MKLWILWIALFSPGTVLASLSGCEAGFVGVAQAQPSNPSGYLASSSWWNEIRKRTEISETQRPWTRESLILQRNGKRVQADRVPAAIRERIDTWINSSSSTLRDPRPYQKIMDEWGLALANGSWAPVPKDPTLIRNARRVATEFAESHIAQSRARGQDPFSEDFLKSLYGKLMAEDPSKVAYRNYQTITGGKTVGGVDKVFEYMPQNQVSPAVRIFLQDLAERIRLRRDPIDTAIWIERTLVSIHPFQDGNGRLSREFASTYLHSEGIPRPLFLQGEEHSFAILPDPDFPMLKHSEIRNVYLRGIIRHLRLLEPR